MLSLERYPAFQAKALNEGSFYCWGLLTFRERQSDGEEIVLLCFYH